MIFVNSQCEDLGMSPARRITLWSLATACAFSGAFAGCSKERPPDSTFYDRKIGPILSASCATSPSNSSCHIAADDRGNALGNLDVESYDALSLRRDLLINYGPYGQPALLLKVLPAYSLQLTSWDGEAQTITTDIAHAGGSILDPASPSYNQLQRWIGNGATRNNAKPAPKQYDKTPCSETPDVDPAFDPSKDPADADFPKFRDNVNDVLGKRCAFGNCHGSAANSLYLTCGTTPEQARWNYFVASYYVATDATQTELLRRALSPEQGGTYHEGGTVFGTPGDAGYKAILDWATAKKGPSNVPTDPGFVFFAKRVQPMLVKRGCMMIGCHSASMFHDYRLRGGGAGHFGLLATRRNYELTLEQVSLASLDPNASRVDAQESSADLRWHSPPRGRALRGRRRPDAV